MSYAPVVKASSHSEIPGTPLVGTSVVSEIGGPTVDHVYSLDVARGTSLFLTLRGAPSAELGLYLFGEDATSVVASDPIAASAIPGADQQISIQFLESTRVFININGRNEDRAYVYQLNVSIVVDRSPPVVRTAVVDDVGRGTAVCAFVDAFDRISGVQSIAVEIQGSTSAPIWRAFRGATKYCADLGLVEGQYRVQVRVRNPLELESVVFAGTINIDNGAPAVALGRPSSGVMLEPRGAVGFRFDEPIWFVGSKPGAIIASMQTGERIDGEVVLADDRRSVRWIPSSPIRPGTIIVATLSQVRDAAGNVTTPNEPHIVTRKQRTSLGLSVVRRSSERIYLSAVGSKNLIGELVQIQVRSGRTWVPFKEVEFSANGVRFSVDLKRWAQARLVWVGNEILHTSTVQSGRFR